jgi:hypothetical protein
VITIFTRLLQISVFALPLGIAAAPASAASGRAIAPEATSGTTIEQVQYYRERRHRGPRCWIENRRVRVQDRFGRVFVQVRPVRVCR